MIPAPYLPTEVRPHQTTAEADLPVVVKADATGAPHISGHKADARLSAVMAGAEDNAEQLVDIEGSPSTLQSFVLPEYLGSSPQGDWIPIQQGQIPTLPLPSTVALVSPPRSGGVALGTEPKPLIDLGTPRVTMPLRHPARSASLSSQVVSTVDDYPGADLLDSASRVSQPSAHSSDSARKCCDADRARNEAVAVTREREQLEEQLKTQLLQ